VLYFLIWQLHEIIPKIFFIQLASTYLCPAFY